MDESHQWVEFGKWLASQREERGIRRRDAAKRAKIPEATWRDLETGRKEAVGGIRLLPNPSNEVLERVAEVLELPLSELLSRIGRHTPNLRAVTEPAARPDGTIDSESLLVTKIRRLSPRDRMIVEHLVDEILRSDD